MSETKYVSAGKPAVGGAISAGEVGTALPKNAIDNLDEALKNLGYISEDGLTNENTRESDNLKAWGGHVVASLQTESEDKFTFTLIEIINIDVLKEVFGQENVTGDLETGITVNVNGKELDARSFISDMILTDGVLKRIVIPKGKIIETGEIVYKDDELAGYEVTVQALPDDKGNTHYEYIQKSTVIKPTATKTPKGEN